FGYPQTGAAGTRILSNFLITGSHPFPNYETEVTFGVGAWCGPFRPINGRPTVFGQVLFYEPIFEAVKSDHDQSATWLQPFGAFGQCRAKRVHLVIDRDPQGLEYTGRRMFPMTPTA